MANYVKFQRGSQTAYDALKKAGRLDENTLYFIYSDENNSVGALYMGNRIISGGDITIASASLDDLADVIINDTGANSFLIKDASGNWISKSLEDVIALIKSEDDGNDLEADNTSIFITNNKISIIGFDSAEAGMFLTKDNDGNATWTTVSIPEVNLSEYSKTNDLIVGLDNGSRLLTSEESKKLEVLVVDSNGQVGISGTVNASNVQELYSNVVKIVTQSGSYEYDGEQKQLLNIQPGAEKNIINSVSNEFNIDDNRHLSLNIVDASKIINLSNNGEFIILNQQVNKNTNDILTISVATEQINKDVEELKNILTWKEL